MLLVVDVGNTNTVVGVYDGKTLKDHFRVASQSDQTADQVGFLLTGLLERMDVAPEDISRVIIASVVPVLTSVFEEAATKYFNCNSIVVSAQIKLPITIDIDIPGQVGADRIANAVAAHAKVGGPVIVVDFGTATNLDVVNSEGAYIGGVLMPGPESSMAELARRAARLFEVRIEKPDRVVGRTTAGALKSGFFYGTIGQVDFVIEKIIDETGFENPTVIATGGLAAGIESASRYIQHVEPTLTLEGLRLINELN